MKIIYLCCVLLLAYGTQAQSSNKTGDESWKGIYRASSTKINDLAHTKLDVRFDYAKSYLYGKAWITLHPHYYPTDSLTLDAKGMEIHEVALLTKTKVLIPLKYTYDGLSLKISLNKKYYRTESYTVYIDYTSRPNELEVKGSSAITDAKGLYFINPTGTIKDKPTQIWTQGETESNSVWFPTIDHPNQKTTSDIYMTVPAKYVSLSNGILVSQRKNTDGSRTDHWNMDLPYAPYLFFMGVGDYAVVKDFWKGKEVSYYVEKKFASVARKIFGLTPEMMSFYSKITGVDYPWPKYAQIVGRDFVSGAMENVTATLHQESAQQDARELIDGNDWESVIAHELFHHWFGDYVTTESWSNITLNESFANYGETLWFEYKYGKDKGDEQNYADMQGYLRSNGTNKNLVRFYYRDKEDVFDAVSYNKGGRILHMLRNYVGDSAFFKALNLYLTTNKFKAAEAQQLRLCFEEVTGQDLNWFWNQWYYGNGHPILNIDYKYDDTAGRVDVIVSQVQKTDKVFLLPFAIDIYNGASRQRYKVWARNKTDTFSFKYTQHPDLINVDGDKVLLTVKTDNKTLDNYIHQYKYAGNFLDRREAIEYASKHQDEEKAVAFLLDAAKDRYDGLRIQAMNRLNIKDDKIRKLAEPILLSLAQKGNKPSVRSSAINLLGKYPQNSYGSLFKNAAYDSSYSIAGNALLALEKIDPVEATAIARQLSLQTSAKTLKRAINSIILKTGDERMADSLLKDFKERPVIKKFAAASNMSIYLSAVSNPEIVKEGIDAIVAFRTELPEIYRKRSIPMINTYYIWPVLQSKQTALNNKPDDPALQSLVRYIKSQLPNDFQPTKERE